MTNIEQEFFKTFEIEPKEYCKHFKYTRSLCDKIDECGCQDCIGKYTDYPEITDRVFLELICILSRKDNNYIVLDKQNNIEQLKQYIIQQLIDNKFRVDENEVQSLFREGENENS